MESQDRFINRTVDEFHIQKKLGAGGMGAVYGAVGRGLTVALKFLLHDPDPEATLRFDREADLATAVPPHPNIVRFFGKRHSSVGTYIIMEYVDGVALDQFIREQDGPVAVNEAVEVCLGMLSGLEFIHSLDFIHRDLKPANILLAGAERTPKITDFGLAKSLFSQALTRSGISLGTMGYMAPEQIEGDKSAIGFACDYWAFGLILYELVTGKMFFSGHSTAAVVKAVFIHKRIDRSGLGGVPTALLDLIDDLTVVDPNARLCDPIEIRARLEAIRANGSGNEPQQLQPTPRQVATRSYGKQITILVVGVLLLAATTGFWLQQRRQQISAIHNSLQASSKRQQDLLEESKSSLSKFERQVFERSISKTLTSADLGQIAETQAFKNLTMVRKSIQKELEEIARTVKKARDFKIPVDDAIVRSIRELRQKLILCEFQEDVVANDVKKLSVVDSRLSSGQIDDFFARFDSYQQKRRLSANRLRFILKLALSRCAKDSTGLTLAQLIDENFDRVGELVDYPAGLSLFAAFCSDRVVDSRRDDEAVHWFEVLVKLAGESEKSTEQEARWVLINKALHTSLLSRSSDLSCLDRYFAVQPRLRQIEPRLLPKLLNAEVHESLFKRHVDRRIKDPRSALLTIYHCASAHYLDRDSKTEPFSDFPSFRVAVNELIDVHCKTNGNFRWDMTRTLAETHCYFHFQTRISVSDTTDVQQGYFEYLKQHKFDPCVHFWLFFMGRKPAGQSWDAFHRQCLELAEQPQLNKYQVSEVLSGLRAEAVSRYAGSKKKPSGAWTEGIIEKLVFAAKSSFFPDLIYRFIADFLRGTQSDWDPRVLEYEEKLLDYFEVYRLAERIQNLNAKRPWTSPLKSHNEKQCLVWSVQSLLTGLDYLKLHKRLQRAETFFDRYREFVSKLLIYHQDHADTQALDRLIAQLRRKLSASELKTVVKDCGDSLSESNLSALQK